MLLLSACLEASVTAAWKIPVEHFAPDYKTNDKVRKLEKPPGESAFFRTGDELWDLSKALSWEKPSELPDNEDPFAKPFAEPAGIKPDQPWQGEWLVWNARAGMAVARGSWNDIFAAQKLIGFEDAPVIVRTRVELVAVGKETLSVSLKADSGKEASAEKNGLQVDLRAKNLGFSGLVDGQFSVSWPGLEKGSRWEANTGVTLEEGKRTRLARRGRGQSRCELVATASREFSYGVPVPEARLIEGPETVTPWPVVPDGDLRKDRLGDRLLVHSYRSFSGELSIPHRDAPAKLVWMDAPAAHAEWVRGRVVDLSGYLRGMGAKLDEPGALAVFDPGSARFTIVGTAEDQDVCEMAILHVGLIDPMYGEDLWVETNPEAGGWGLTCRSGEKARIAQSKGDQAGPSFEVEPTSSELTRLVDLHYDFNVFSKGAVAGHLKGSTLLEIGKPQEIAGHLAGEGEEKVVLTVSEN